VAIVDIERLSDVSTRRRGSNLRFATVEIDDVSLAEWTLAERLSDDRQQCRQYQCFYPNLTNPCP